MAIRNVDVVRGIGILFVLVILPWTGFGLEHLRGQHMSDVWRKCNVLRLARVEFAITSAIVKVLSQRRARDGEIVYHVEDIGTGHQDFVGKKFMKFFN